MERCTGLKLHIQHAAPKHGFNLTLSLSRFAGWGDGARELRLQMLCTFIWAQTPLTPVARDLFPRREALDPVDHLGEKGGERERFPLASYWQSSRSLSISSTQAESSSILPSLWLPPPPPPRTSREALPRGLPQRGWPLRDREAVLFLRTDPSPSSSGRGGKEASF